ncbi:MAG: hypothetical protein QM493_02810 [Sulfurovum sp.]
MKKFFISLFIIYFGLIVQSYSEELNNGGNSTNLANWFEDSSYIEYKKTLKVKLKLAGQYDILHNRVLFLENLNISSQISKEESSIKKNKAAQKKQEGLLKGNSDEGNQEIYRGNIQRYKSKIKSSEKKKEELNQYIKELDEKEAELITIKQKRIEIDYDIAIILNRDSINNSFRTKISFAFTFLVLVVIGGFYYIVSKDDKLISTIFGGDQGIQFVSLFLIIIAIILFGIMGTLKSQELSTLLGALSGYILGKTSGRNIDNKEEIEKINTQDKERK